MKVLLISCCQQNKSNLSLSCHRLNYSNFLVLQKHFFFIFFLNFINGNIIVRHVDAITCRKSFNYLTVQQY